MLRDRVRKESDLQDRQNGQRFYETVTERKAMLQDRDRKESDVTRQSERRAMLRESEEETDITRQS